MSSNFIAGGCSFTYGSELSDDDKGKKPSNHAWSSQLYRHGQVNGDYICTARPGIGNSAIARRVFNAVANLHEIECVVVMWTFVSRYDWAMPRHKDLESTR